MPKPWVIHDWTGKLMMFGYKTPQNNPAGIGVWFNVRELKRIGRVP